MSGQMPMYEPVEMSEQLIVAWNLTRNMSQVLQNRCASYFPVVPLDANKSSLSMPAEKYSGRVGRSASAKSLDEKSILLAVIAHIRHTETNYDEFLAQGMDRSLARDEVKDVIDKVLKSWK